MRAAGVPVPGAPELAAMAPEVDAECSASTGAAVSLADNEPPFTLTSSALFRFAQATSDNAIAQTARIVRRESALLREKRGRSLRLSFLGIMSHTPASPDCQIVPSAARPFESLECLAKVALAEVLSRHMSPARVCYVDLGLVNWAGGVGDSQRTFSSMPSGAELSERASRRIGRHIFLLSDEPYRRLRLDGRDFVSPAALYPWTLISYSYGKVLLAPGQRLGYLAIAPTMPTVDRQLLRDAMYSTQMALGWCFPNAVMQNAVPHVEGLSIDVRALERRRDALGEALTKAGHAVLPPEGTFYLRVGWASSEPERQWNARL